jgi:hypothetical protein
MARLKSRPVKTAAHAENPQVIDRMILFRLRFVPSQVRRKNKDAPNLGHPNLGSTSLCQRPGAACQAPNTEDAAVKLFPQGKAALHAAATATYEARLIEGRPPYNRARRAGVFFPCDQKLEPFLPEC